MIPESNLSRVPRIQGSRIKPQSYSVDTGFKNKIPVIFPGQRVPQSNLSHVAVHRFLRSNPSQFCRPQGSRIKPQSCGQATGFQNQTDLLFPRHRVPESSLSHVARPQGSRIKPCSCSQATGFQNPPMSCSQATGFQNQSSVMFPGYRVLE